MARRKPKNVYLVRDLAEANAVLAEIAAVRRTLAGIEAELNTRIDQAKKLSEAAAAKHLERLQALESGLLAFAEYNKDELFQDRRTRELDFGALGYRKSSEIKPITKSTWEMVLGNLRDMGFSEAVRSKEEVDKDVLRTWPDGRLEIVGARRVEKDTFWFEVKEHKVEENAA
ncbi:host-nuclease inhibitor Gam family protein [Desulfocurvibacter africanus]|uniref:Host-nuclease inhibitor protein Gam, putative n=1 Tax=Desulfocurvibacter africanus subsp. africanus str. Walvis Bay TaxID=690850 RepID=F3YVZ1_DESAF|nr:host-nuclease inhibitor Gam family protein [Desulfocurvibacter africanus]EGJ49021.1 host-nuclease inhibitor protein Gam, putative [Desulfocurvibacter africanus subsp. africanus str. Walvis Bay]